MTSKSLPAILVLAIVMFGIPAVVDGFWSWLAIVAPLTLVAAWQVRWEKAHPR